jgi:deoxyuridine 5'-triphosphate nucleotidohydrolase
VGRLWSILISPSLSLPEPVSPQSTINLSPLSSPNPLYIDGRIAPRSGLASKNFIDVGAGVIDADYRGQVKVLLFNHSDSDFEVKEGDRVAQLVLERVCSFPFVQRGGGCG